LSQVSFSGSKTSYLPLHAPVDDLSFSPGLPLLYLCLLGASPIAATISCHCHLEVPWHFTCSVSKSELTVFPPHLKLGRQPRFLSPSPPHVARFWCFDHLKILEMHPSVPVLSCQSSSVCPASQAQPPPPPTALPPTPPPQGQCDYPETGASATPPLRAP
jgi:hypothetical protein